MIYYHVTPKGRLSSIMSRGLTPSLARLPEHAGAHATEGIYLSDSVSDAETEAEGIIDSEGDATGRNIDIAILRVDLPGNIVARKESHPRSGSAPYVVTRSIDPKYLSYVKDVDYSW